MGPLKPLVKMFPWILSVRFAIAFYGGFGFDVKSC